MITIGLTGSIGMGKSTTALMFAEAGAMVWDADDAVHRLYAAGGEGAAAIAKIVPEAITEGAVDRIKLRAAIMADAALLKQIEAVIHPLVAKDRAAALSRARAKGKHVAVLDIPLIFETGATDAFDAIVVASAPPDLQRERVLARPNMTEAAFEAILEKQVPDAEKRAKADFVVDTGGGMEDARAQVAEIMKWAEQRLQESDNA